MNRTAFTIRQATEADYGQLCDLFAELDLLHRSARPDLFRKPEGPPRERSYVARLIASPASAILVAAQRDARILHGFATLIGHERPATPVSAARRIVEIDNLCVHAHARRQGIGGALVDGADRWARQKGYDGVELSVHAFNDDARKFYEASGFETASLRMTRAPTG